ncbi:M23 family metallopeptidase [Desulfitobacterium sp. THU1]|uniref:M23 family metallopeptidase n=1 Tax=Desulfitobacterium sp. THU1 TaxID=3138072 RepID=UPI00311E3627
MKFGKRFETRERLWMLIIKAVAVLVISLSLWKGLHMPPRISPDIYLYLTNLSTDLVLNCQREGENLSATGWADLLALKSSITETEQAYLIRQLEQGVFFQDLSWQNEVIHIKKETVKQLLWRREILLTYPLYEPNRFVFPVIGEVWFIDTFGADREGGIRRHEGTDIFGAEGIPIISVSDGVIEKLGWNRLGGERVGVRGEDGNYYYYAHLQTINPKLMMGQKVKKGDALGTLGHTGVALTTPDHLHFGIELPNGEWVNPYPFVSVWQQN